MWTARFWKDAAERAIKTAVQVATPMVAAASLDKVDWATAGLTVASAVLLSLFSSILSSQVGKPEDASLVNQPQPVPPTTLAGGGVGK